MRRAITISSIGALLVAFFYFRAVTNVHEGQTPIGEEVLSVETDTVRVQAMPVSIESSGQVVAEHMVQIRPQVSGLLKKVFITEGQRVSVGQRLFLIEPESFEAAVVSARAVWQSADGKLQRAVTLAKQGYVSSQDLVAARAAADQAQAAYKQALINLEYTDIKAPLSGRTGVLGLKSGNVVAPTDPTPLVTINETRPIQVQFGVPQQSLLTIREHQSLQRIKIQVNTEDGRRTLDQGTLVFVDNAIDIHTGTVLLKARTPNAQEQLWPGQYVLIHMQLALQPRAIVVPQTAVQTGQNGDFVYLIEDDKAQPRSVKIDREVGAFAVIANGLEGAERVIVRVPRGLRAGIRVVARAAPVPEAVGFSPSDP